MYNREFTPKRLRGGVKDNEVWVVADVFPGISDGICSISKTEICYAECPEFETIWSRHYFIPLEKDGIKALKPRVNRFIKFAAVHKEYKFITFPFGIGFVGFNQEEVALLFEKAIDVENIILPKDYVKILNTR